MIKLICQYCNRPTKGDDLIKWMCSLCRAFYGHISDKSLRKSMLKRLQKLLQEDTAWLVDRIAKTQNQQTSAGRDSCLKDYREFLAGKQHELIIVKGQLNQHAELTGQDMKIDRLMRELTQQEYAELIGVTKRHLIRIEKGLIGINNKMRKRFENVTFSRG